MSLQIRNLKLNDSRNQTLDILNSSTAGITTCNYKIKPDILNDGKYYIVDNNGNKVNNDLKLINFTINIENIPLLKKILLFSSNDDIFSISSLEISDNSSNIQIMNIFNVDTLNSNYYFNFLDKIENGDIITNFNNNIIITVLC